MKNTLRIWLICLVLPLAAAQADTLQLPGHLPSNWQIIDNTQFNALTIQDLNASIRGYVRLTDLRVDGKPDQTLTKAAEVAMARQQTLFPDQQWQIQGALYAHASLGDIPFIDIYAEANPLNRDKKPAYQKIKIWCFIYQGRVYEAQVQFPSDLGRKAGPLLSDMLLSLLRADLPIDPAAIKAIGLPGVLPNGWKLDSASHESLNLIPADAPSDEFILTREFQQSPDQYSNNAEWDKDLLAMNQSLTLAKARERVPNLLIHSLDQTSFRQDDVLVATIQSVLSPKDAPAQRRANYEAAFFHQGALYVITAGSDRRNLSELENEVRGLLHSVLTPVR